MLVTDYKPKNKIKNPREHTDEWMEGWMGGWIKRRYREGKRPCTFSPALTLLVLSDHLKVTGTLGKEQPNTATKASPDTFTSELLG